VNTIAVNVALEAITEAVNILYTLKAVTYDERWVTDSVPLANLNKLAKKMGFPDALAVQERVEEDREHEANKYRDMDPGWF